MPRNNDGKVVKVMNWTDEDANNRSFTGSKLESDTRDLADVIQDSLDVRGRNVMQNNLRLENNRAIDAADPIAEQDLVNLRSMQAYVLNGVLATDNGSLLESATLKLKTSITDLTSLEDGLTITFTAPFTLTPAIAKALERYEVLELELQGGSITKNIARAKYTEDDNYTDGIKDNRPSFIQGRRYTLQFNASLDAWVTKDDKQQGEIITIAKDYGYTPAGYIDLAYNYPDYGNVGDYPYLASHQPQLTLSDPDDEESDKVVTSEVGKEEISMLPNHAEKARQTSGATTAGNGTQVQVAVITTPSDTLGTVSLDTSKYIIGDRIKPHTKYIRYLVKM